MNPIASTSWWWQALTSDLSLRCLAIAAVCIILLGLGCMALLRTRKPSSRRVRAAEGTATMEFALVVPFILFVMLALAQTTFLMSGNLFVHYAAFAATRSAIVIIPSAADGEPPNYIYADSGGEKFEAIRTAAALAVAPVSGKLSGAVGPGEDVVEGLREYYSAYGRNDPQWVSTLIADRIRYADAYTDITVLRTTVVDSQDVILRDQADEIEDLPFGPREPVTISVSHRFKLTVPYIWPIFADDSEDGRYTTITASYTLINEGIVDELPPPPRLPRRG